MTETDPKFRHDFFLPASTTEVFRACTEPERLRVWFAEHCEVDPRVGGSYRFWGRHTLGMPDADQADQQITVWNPGSSLGYRWTWLGVATEVEMSFAEGDEPSWHCVGEGAPSPRKGTTLTVEQRFEKPLPLPRPEHAADDFWRLTMGNLAAHLGGGGDVVLPDFGAADAVVRLSIEIDAPPSDVFRALTEPQMLNRWLAKAATVDPKVGGVFDLGWSDVEGASSKILAMETDRLLSITWPDWRGTAGVPDQTVTWRLEPLAGGARTRVEFTHEGFERTVDRSDYQQGWVGFLDALARVVPTPSND